MTQGRLTTHVLDTTRGRPAAGVSVTLWRLEGCRRVALAEAVTNADGRTDAPLLGSDALRAGVYELEFDAGAYLRAQGEVPAQPAFLDIIPIRFGISDPQAHHHVPLLLAAHGYSTYRGS